MYYKQALTHKKGKLVYILFFTGRDLSLIQCDGFKYSSNNLVMSTDQVGRIRIMRSLSYMQQTNKTLNSFDSAPWWLQLLPHSKKVLGSNSPFGYSSFLSQSRHVVSGVGLTDEYKLGIGVPCLSHYGSRYKWIDG